MSEFNKYSTDGGATFIDVEDSNAVHWGDQSKGYVGKNLIQNTAVNSKHYDVTFVINNDKSITLNGTQNTSSEHTDVVIGVVTLKAGKYIVTGTHRGANDVAFQITDYPVTQQLFRIYSGDTEITLDNDTTIAMRIPVSGGAAFNNFTLYPMIRLASVSDSTYEPYLTPNTDLMSYADNTILGAKNLLTYPYADKTKTEGGITFTDNGDGSITLNGTSDSVYPSFTCMTSSNLATLLSKYGSLRLTGAINGSNIRLYTHGSKYFIDDGNGVVIPSTETSFSEPLRIQVLPNKTIDNVTIRPMLRLESDTDDTYVPYAMTNRELTDIFTNQITGFYAKRINLPANSIRYITAEFGYQPIFMIGQRNLSLLFWNLGSSVSSKTICRDSDSDVPSITFEATKKTKITNNVNAELSFLVLSYGDFTLSES